MKRHTILTAMALCSLLAQAQTIKFSNGSVTYCFPADMAGEMPFTGESVTVASRTFNLARWLQITVSDEAVPNNTVRIQYADTSAAVTVSGDIAPYVEAGTEGAHVTVTQSELVSDATCGEITYILEGASTDGSLTLNGSYKSTIELRGIHLVNPAGAAIGIQNGKRIAISAKNGTDNFLSDGPGNQKGVIECKGHIEFKGKGQLTLKGNASHAVYAKEYVEIKNLTLNITGAVKDGINCGQYFTMESGTVDISGTGDDGIQASFKDETDREAEDTGAVTIKGGTISATTAADAAKCIKADGDITVAEGTVCLTSTSNGIWDSTKSKTKAAACLGSDGNITISGGSLELKATGSGGKGISCDGWFTSDGGATVIATSGGMLVYSSNTLSHNYTGSADRISSNYKSSAKGIKADSGVVINGGDIRVTTATNNAEGIESKKELDIKGGSVFVKAYDDGINSANDFRVSGGNLTVISSVGDGLDSNGNLTISGGYIRTMGAGGMEMGLDANTESGCAVYLTGGTLFAYGGSNTYPTRSGSTQAFVKTTGSIKADTEISVQSGNETIASFTVPSEYSSTTSQTPSGPGGGGWRPGDSSGSGSVMVSCPQMVSGQSYTVVNGTASTSATAALTGSGR